MLTRVHRKGFTLAECLISIGLLSISITGVLAALSYDLLSSEQTGVYTFANAYNRRVMDLVQSSQIVPETIAANGAPANPNLPWQDQAWRPLDQGPLANDSGVVRYLWGAPGSVELQRFDGEKLRFQTNVVINRLVPTSSGVVAAERFKNLISEMIITTRWNSKGRFRFVRLHGNYSTLEKRV